MKKGLTILIAVTLLLSLTACLFRGEETVVIEDEPVAETPTLEVTGDESRLLELKVDGFEEQSVAAFDEQFRPYEPLYTGYGRNHPELDFMQTLQFANAELLGEENRETPWLSIGTGGQSMMLDYRMSWTIPDKDDLTVRERTSALLGCMNGIEELMAGEHPTDEGEMQQALDALATAQSTERIEIELLVEALTEQV